MKYLVYISTAVLLFLCHVNSILASVAPHQSTLSDSSFSKEIEQGDINFQNSNYGNAILHYERARKYDSTNQDLLRNLKSAYLETNNRANVLIIEDIYSYGHYLSNPRYRDLWAILSILSLLFWGVFKVLSRESRTLNRLKSSLLISFLICSSITIYAFKTDKEFGIVMENNLNVYETTSGISTTISVLNSGYKVEIIKTIDEWTKITLATGKTGWVINDNLIPV